MRGSRPSRNPPHCFSSDGVPAMCRCLTLVALLTLAIGCAPASAAPALSNVSSAHCEIRSIPIPGGLRVEGVVRGEPGLAGSYRLLLDEHSLNDVSEVAQGGAFI